MEATEKNKKVFFEKQSSYIRVADVMNYEGLLLTLFLNTKNDQLYLLDWFNVGADYNRWLFYITNVSSIDKYIRKEISTLDLSLEGESTCTTIDIGADCTWTNPQVLAKNSIPSEDLPSRDSFFNKFDCPNLNKLQEFLKSRMSQHRATA